MPHFTMNARADGELEFSVLEGGGYVRCNGEQITQNGSTLTATAATLKKAARAWRRRSLAANRP